MSGVFIFLVVIVILGIVIPLAMAHARAVNRAWESAAQTLGLQHSPAAFLKSRRLEGNLEGFQVVVDTYTQSSGKHSQTYTRFRVTFPPLGLGLRLTREGMMSNVTKFFGAQDIQVGDPGFDHAILVKGQSEHATRDFLTPSRRMRIHRFFNGHHSAIIDDHSLRWDRRGVVSQPQVLVDTIRAMTRVAWHLTGERATDRKLETAMKLQDEGRPDEALRTIEAVVVPPKQPESTEFLAEPVEEKLLHAELKYLEGDQEAAHSEFRELEHLAPDDADIQDWIEYTKPDADHGETRHPHPPTSFERQAFCDHVFGEGRTSYEVNRAFDARYQGHEVQWSGELQKVEKNYSSFVFESSTGYKATFKIDERPSPYYGTHNVLAVVHLSDEVAGELNDRLGEEVAFQGTLVKADGLMRNVYLDHGKVTGNRGE